MEKGTPLLNRAYAKERTLKNRAYTKERTLKNKQLKNKQDILEITQPYYSHTYYV